MDIATIRRSQYREPVLRTILNGLTSSVGEDPDVVEFVKLLPLKAVSPASTNSGSVHPGSKNILNLRQGGDAPGDAAAPVPPQWPIRKPELLPQPLLLHMDVDI
jgi:hypothetical protein